MAQDTLDLPLNFKFWLNKAVAWGQATTFESQQDVCLHLPQLQKFLQQIYETLKHMDFPVAIQRFPLIGQLLGRLCWNPFVIGYDENQKILMWCLCCLYCSEPRNPIELEANIWIRSLLCHLLSSSKLGPNEVGTISQALGYTSPDYYPKLLKNMVLSLVTELRVNHLNGFSIRKIIPDRPVKAMSLLCVPLLTLPDILPLLEALLTYHGDEPKEVLCSEFLEGVNEAFLQKKIALSESAILSLWLRHLPSLEKATLNLFENLISRHRNFPQEMECFTKDSLLPQAACHPSIFRIVDEIFRNALLETNGTSEVLTIIQVFTRCFVQAFQKDNQQVDAREAHGCIMKLFSRTPLSVKDLQAVAGESSEADTRHPYIQRLMRHLLLNFLLLSPEGHKIAQEFITTQTDEIANEFLNLIAHTTYRWRRLGIETLRPGKLARDLLQELQCYRTKSVLL
ncbi:Fanconi anemia group C protein isoform X2 [Phascolarctos cinereus]|uniref:Fanconi anemia group C protein isoform X2 n=1 Tax=Phascolarctos cinereus TaxID=38626 RepID=A0A6P5J872_PHACI|nr:Fanconi anemia group C protein isoform X2 [Phascolarctos cinereus]